MENDNGTATPQPAAGATPEAQAAPAAEPVATNVAPETTGAAPSVGGEGNAAKKSHTGAIIGIAAGVVVLGGVGVYAYTSSQPENVALSAFSNFLNAKAISLSGTFSALQEDSYSGDSNKVIVTLKDDTQKLNDAATASVSIEMAGMDKAVEADLGTVFLEDGTLYLKIDKLKDALNTAIETMSDSSYNAIMTQYVESIFGDLIGEIDGQWWKINVEEVTNGLYDRGLIKSSDKNTINDGWACTLDYMKKVSEKQGEIADVYKDNQFITIKAHSGDLTNSAGISLDEFKKAGSLYDLSFDAGKLTSFANVAAQKLDTDSLTSCLVDKGIITESQKEKTEEIQQADVEAAIKDLPSIVVATSGMFSHNLTGLYVDYADDATKTTTALTFSYPGKLSIAAPGDAKPVMDLYDSVMETVNKINSANYYYNTVDYAL